MVHLLTAIRTGVDQGLEAPCRTVCAVLVSTTVFLRQFRGDEQHFTQQRLMAIIAIGQGRNMLSRDHQQMHGRSRIDIVKNNQILILKYLFRGDRTGNNLAENAVIQNISPILRSHPWNDAPHAAAQQQMMSLLVGLILLAVLQLTVGLLLNPGYTFTPS
jgi:hypothetical protein